MGFMNPLNRERMTITTMMIVGEEKGSGTQEEEVMPQEVEEENEVVVEGEKEKEVEEEKAKEEEEDMKREDYIRSPKARRNIPASTMSKQLPFKQPHSTLKGI
jgi:hypothetical protein